MSKLVILCKPEQKEQVCKFARDHARLGMFGDKIDEVEIYTDINDIPENIRSMISNNDAEFCPLLSDEEVRNIFMKEPKYSTNTIELERERMRRDQIKQNKYALRYANKHGRPRKK